MTSRRRTFNKKRPRLKAAKENPRSASKTIYTPLSIPDLVMQEVAILQGERPGQAGRQKDPPDNILEGRRNDIATMFEMNWHKIGWSLQRLRKPRQTKEPEDIRR